MPELTWVGKDKVKNHHHEVPFRLLKKEYRFDANEGLPENSTDNRIIHGDNLEALKSLLPEFEGKIKCIYIDPPYNTGNEGWVYNDNVNDPKIKAWLGAVVGKEGEDLTRHDKWLCMMYPRLKLLHKLLANDGLILVSIDDAANYLLRLLMNEIFGASNHLGTIVWKKKTNGNNVGHIPSVHDYLICFAKKESSVYIPGFPLSEEYLDKNYKNTDKDPRGRWTTQDLSANHKGPHFPIKNEKTGKIYLPPKGRYWVFNEKEVEKRIKDGRIIFGKTGNAGPVQKVFLKDKVPRKKAESWWDKHGMNSDGTENLAQIFPEHIEGKIFDHSKPATFITNILRFASSGGDIILDSFAGTGTTAQAVLELNKDEESQRKFILVEMMDYAETITAERVRRVINGYGEGDKKVPGLGGGFDYYTIGEPLFLEDQNLNESVGIEAIRKYVAYSEKVELNSPETISDVSPYSLGLKDDALFVFYYEPNQVTTLGKTFLSQLNVKALPEKPSSYVIYADKCTLEPSFMQKYGINFKRIPRDISRF